MIEDTRIHVAFADDHNLMRDGVISLLKETGNAVIDIQAEDGQELLEKLEQAASLPDICIIDISMPVMGGHEVLLEIRKRWPDMKTLILTTHSSETLVIRMMLAGANGYLLKKCSAAEINEALVSIHTKGYYYSECAGSRLFHLVKTNAIKLPVLTDDETEMLRYCGSELKYEEIAAQLNISISSVHGRRTRLLTKLNFNSRIELTLYALQLGLVALDDTYPGKSNISHYKKR